MSTIEKLTPQMKAYSSHFADSGIINWLPYTMYFHPFSYTSPTVNTDLMGFRYSDARGCRYSFADLEGISGVRLLAGSSTVFGIGASADRHTLASRLTENDTRPEFWINFGGRSFNSTQELILYVLHRQMLPRVAEIVLFSGFNDLGLAHLPARYRRAHGAFFNCGDFYDALTKPRSTGLGSWFGRTAEEDTEDDVPGIDRADRICGRSNAPSSRHLAHNGERDRRSPDLRATAAPLTGCGKRDAPRRRSFLPSLSSAVASPRPTARFSSRRISSLMQSS